MHFIGANITIFIRIFSNKSYWITNIYRYLTILSWLYPGFRVFKPFFKVLLCHRILLEIVLLIILLLWLTHTESASFDYFFNQRAIVLCTVTLGVIGIDVSWRERSFCHRDILSNLRLKYDITELLPQLVLQSLIEVPAMPTSEDDTR